MKKETKRTGLAKRTPQTAIATPADVARVEAAVREYAAAAKSENTRSAYENARAHFEAWCLRFRRQPWPAAPETVAAYFADCAKEGAAWGTVTVRRAAISVWHRLNGHIPPPTKDPRVGEIVAGIRNKARTPAQRAPLTVDMIPTIMAGIAPWPDLPRLRLRALLLVGVATGLRGEQLAALRWRDLHWRDAGVSIRIGKEKTDQRGRGRFVHVPIIGGDLCPVSALEDLRGFRPQAPDDPVFPSFRRGGHATPRAINRKEVRSLVKIAVEAGGFDPADFGAHSLRSGFVTAARARGMDWGDIMKQTGHKRIETALKYERPDEGDPVTFEKLAKMWQPKGAKP